VAIASSRSRLFCKDRFGEDAETNTRRVRYPEQEGRSIS